jgi:hypothetical protein
MNKLEEKMKQTSVFNGLRMETCIQRYKMGSSYYIDMIYREHSILIH